MSIARDTTFALRSLLKTPLFTLTATLSMGVGIAGAVAIFSLANGLLLRPVPGIAQPEGIVRVHAETGEEQPLGLSYPDYRDLREVHPALAAFTDATMSLAAGGEAELVLGQTVSGNYFSVLGVRPAAGRLLQPGEEAPAGGHPVAVISHGLWQRRFGGDPAVVGGTVSINGVPFTVVGVAPEGFRGTFLGFRYDVWVPLAMAAVTEPGADPTDRAEDWLEVVGRMRPGESPAAVEARLSAAVERLAREYPREGADTGVRVSPLTGFDDDFRAGVLGLVGVLAVAAGLLLLVASVNVANMLLARSLGRTREVAVRLALGAGRGRVVRQLLVESALLALAGGLAGLLLAAWITSLFSLFQLPPPLTVELDLSADARVLAFAFLVSMAAGLLAGLAPALGTLRPDLVPALKDASFASGSRSRLRGAFVVGQLAVSLLLLVAAGLFLRTLWHAAAADPGFDPDGIEVAVLDLTHLRLDQAEGMRTFELLAQRVAALPGVESVSLARRVPLSLGGVSQAQVRVEGVEPPPGEEAFRVGFNAVAPGFFETLGAPLVAGRDFGEGDRAGERQVAVVSRAMAELFWPGREAVGRRFFHGQREVEVVGVAEDLKIRRLSEDPRPYFYRPFAQEPGLRMDLLVRRAAGAAPLAAAIRGEVRALSREAPVVLLLPLRRVIALALLPQRLAGSTAGALGLVGLVLAAVGLYGVTAFSVSRRTREIGLRMTLGARPADVLRMVLGQGLRLAVLGVALGTAGALAATRLLKGLLHGVSPADPLTYGVIAAFLVATALVASYLPARRAARLDPMATLRWE